jgi:hypothetical protein
MIRRPLTAHVVPTSESTVRVSVRGIVPGGRWHRVGQFYGARQLWNECAAGLRLRGHDVEEVETAASGHAPTRGNGFARSRVA